MFALSRNYLFSARRPPAVVRGLSKLTLSPQATRSKARQSRLSSQSIAFATGGTGLAVAALIWSGHGGEDYVEDPRGKEALSAVPLPKLISGWV